MFFYTYSLFYDIEAKDAQEIFLKLKDDLAFNAYPKDHFMFSDANEKNPLKLADELRQKIIIEAVFLKPKAYSIEISDEEKSPNSVLTQLKDLSNTLFITIKTNQIY